MIYGYSAVTGAMPANNDLYGYSSYELQVRPSTVISVSIGRLLINTHMRLNNNAVEGGPTK